MNKKLGSILLVDDDEATNYIHKRVIIDHGSCENIIVKTNGEEALNYLIDAENSDQPIPEIIFLDINMPRVDGWEFLEAYKKLPVAYKAKIVIVMLTTSLNKYDKERAESIELVSEFRNKLLSAEMLDEIIDSYFNS